MGRSASIARDATFFEEEKLWNPSKTLGIINTDSGYECITCVGYAPSQRRRCRNPIRKDNREFIMETLDDIAYMQPDSPAVVSRLRLIAGPALCVRYHQSQAETIVMEWQKKLQHLKPRKSEQRATKHIQSNEKQDSMHDPRISDIAKHIREMQESLAKLQEGIDDLLPQDQRYERLEEQAIKDRREKERRRSEQVEREARIREKTRLEKERQERLEEERLETERLEKKRLKKERLERERMEKERREREETKRRESEQAAKNERIRQRAQKLREERERERQEREQKEREEWNQSWTAYQEEWALFKAAISEARNLPACIPWPVKSRSHRDVNASNVEEFLKRGPSGDAKMAHVLRKEAQKWHPDMINRLIRVSELAEVEKMMLDMICRKVTELINSSAARSSECRD